MSSDLPRDRSAESVFAAWLERLESGEGSDLEALCREHAPLAPRLRALHRRWLRFRDAWPSGAAVASRRPDGEASGSRLAHSVTERLLELEPRGPDAERYEIEDEVGRGGMGAVLQVWDRGLRRHLAMKVMLEHRAVTEGAAPSADPRLLSRFLDEAEVTGRLDHPGVVPVHELGLDAEGHVYFTMKLVEGTTLREVFEQFARGDGGWTQVRVLGVLQRVCDAMSYAHAKGVIHRDLKPANVMVGRYGETYVMDWGLAHQLGREDGRDIRPRAEPGSPEPAGSAAGGDGSSSDLDLSLRTMEGDVVGTPAYMPPEQARGDLAAMGPHSDVYAVGAMLYHLLAGGMPYVRPGEPVDNHEVWTRVRRGPPRPLHTLAPSAPAELVAICERAMAREPVQRYPDMSALARDLAAYVEGRVVSAYETGAWAEARKWVRRNRSLASALAAAVVLLVVGLVTALVLRQQAAEHEALARRSEEVARKKTADVLSLSAFRSLELLEEQAGRLWPPHPEQLEAYDDWIGRAQVLVAGLEPDPASGDVGHRARLEDLRTRALPGSPAEREDEQDSPPSWRFESEADLWWHEQLERLIRELEELQDPEVGLWMGDTVGNGWGIEHRRAVAAELERVTGSDPRGVAAWAAAARRVAASSAYEGIDLVPQAGLVPLGPDPASGLEEFGHPVTGTIPERDDAGRLILGEETGLVFVLLPGGTFLMGAQSRDPEGPNYDPQAESDESPVHEVTVSAFFLSKFEMTQGQWARFALDRPARNGPMNPDSLSRALLHPVEKVSWARCSEVGDRLGLRLPSEAEWEYGARGGTSTPWWTGDSPETLAGAANLADRSLREVDRGRRTHAWLTDGAVGHAPVGDYAPNPFGLHDVCGNVKEWCRDHFRTYLAEPRTDPVADEASWGRGYVRRGGSYYETAYAARSSFRNNWAHAGFADTGWRPARSLQAP